MDENVRSQLITLISGLYFMSESEYPFTIEELHENNFSQIEKNILSKYEPQLKLKRFETSDFFNRIINNFEIKAQCLTSVLIRWQQDPWKITCDRAVNKHMIINGIAKGNVEKRNGGGHLD